MRFCGLLVAVALSLPAAMPSQASNAAEVAGAEAPTAQQLVDSGVAFLRKSQADDGSFSKQAGPGVTAIVATGLLENGVPASDPMVAKALAYLKSFVRSDGAVAAEGSKYSNYETCMSIRAFQAANADGKYDDLLKNSGAYIKQIQWDGEEDHGESSDFYGGAGYGGHGRPDLSNTTFLLDALEALDTPADDEAVQRALVFVSRCQNLPSKYNETKFPELNPDGGFYYTIAQGGSSQAGELPNGGLRSYGSMTYAGLKSMLYAGVNKDDPRVQAAVEWLRKHYSLEENPGMGDSGLYYYFHTFAKSLKAYGEANFAEQDGDQHDWKQELIAALASRQKADGSWANANERWLEGDPNLATGYALLALSYVK
jgi:hypothetical protein